MESIPGHPPSRRSQVARFRFGALALAAGLGLALGNAGCRQPAEETVPLEVGSPAPEFTRPDLNGEPIALSRFAGRPVVVDFWATWCGPCHIQARVLEPLVAEYRDRVTFVAVSLGEEPDTVRRFFGATPPPYPVLLDPTDALSAQYRIHALPTMLVIGKDGTVVFFEAGIADAPTLREALAAAGA